MKASKGVRLVVGLVLAFAIAGLVVYKVAVTPSVTDWIADKYDSIIVPKSQPGNLTPARDLRGTWVSSLPGKGIQLYGKFEAGGGVTNVYEDGDVELIIEKVENNTATGKMRFYNLCAYGEGIFPSPVGKIAVPKQCFSDEGFKPVSIKVSASSVDFGTFNNGTVTASMRGSFTTDIMSGAMSSNIEPYGTVKGEFHFIRKQ